MHHWRFWEGGCNNTGVRAMAREINRVGQHPRNAEVDDRTKHEKQNDVEDAAPHPADSTRMAFNCLPHSVHIGLVPTGYAHFGHSPRLIRRLRRYLRGEWR